MKGDGGSMATHENKVNGGFWELPAEQRAQAEQDACVRYGVEDFFDLEPAQRHETYERALAVR